MATLLIAASNCCGHRLSVAFPRSKSSPLSSPVHFFFSSNDCQKLSTSSVMQVTNVVAAKEMPLGVDATTMKEYSSEAELLREFTNIPSIDKAWIFKSDSGLRGFLGIMKKHLLPILLKSHFHPSQYLIVYGTKEKIF